MTIHRESYYIPGEIDVCYDAKWILVLFSAAHRKKGLLLLKKLLVLFTLPGL